MIEFNFEVACAIFLFSMTAPIMYVLLVVALKCLGIGIPQLDLDLDLGVYFFLSFVCTLSINVFWVSCHAMLYHMGVL